jgi:hypothetical protein
MNETHTDNFALTILHNGGQLFIYALLVSISATILCWLSLFQLSRFLPARFIPFSITHM